MGWFIFGLLFVIIFMFAFAFGKMVKESMKYFWYEYYEDEYYNDEDDFYEKNTEIK